MITKAAGLMIGSFFVLTLLSQYDIINISKNPRKIHEKDLFISIIGI